MTGSSTRLRAFTPAIRAESLREAARFILACDQEVKDVNDRKKEFFAELRDDLTDKDISALKDAIKVHRKRLKDKDAAEAHDERVWEVLSIIEGSEVPKSEGTAPRARKTALAGIVEEMAPTRDARDPPHDAETGELTEPESIASSVVDGASESPPLATGGNVPALSPESLDAGDMPAFLRRSAA
jgi:hypothetical protein